MSDITAFSLKETDIRKRREDKFTESVIGIDRHGRTILDLRIYNTPAKTTAVVWLRSYGAQEAYGRGAGTAKGYNHTTECAVNALETAGIVFGRNMRGSDIVTIAETVTKAIAGEDFLCVVHAHG